PNEHVEWILVQKSRLLLMRRQRETAVAKIGSAGICEMKVNVCGLIVRIGNRETGSNVCRVFGIDARVRQKNGCGHSCLSEKSLIISKSENSHACRCGATGIGLNSSVAHG